MNVTFVNFSSLERYKIVSARQLEDGGAGGNGPAAGTKINIAPPATAAPKKGCC